MVPLGIATVKLKAIKAADSSVTPLPTNTTTADIVIPAGRFMLASNNVSTVYNTIALNLTRRQELVAAFGMPSERKTSARISLL
jgi:hypothetical protein